MSWDNETKNGLWNDPLNWSLDRVPGAVDTAILSLPSSPAVLLDGGIAAVSELTMSKEMTLVVDGSSTTLTVSRGGQIDGARVVATGGGRVSISFLDSFRDTSTAFFLSLPRFEASGSGSLIELPDLTTVRAREGGALVTAPTVISAQDGGAILLRRLSNLPSGYISFIVGDRSSLIDLSSLTNFVGNSGTQLGLDLDGGGKLLLGPVKTLVRADVHLQNGATLPLPVATNIDGSRFTVTGGSKFLRPPLITTYNGNFDATSLAAHTGFSAIGPGSLIDLRGLTTLQGNSFLFQDSDIVATDGGAIDLSDLRTNSSGQIYITAESSGIGSASKIGLSALEEYYSVGPVTRTIYLNVGGNGVVALPKLRVFQNADVDLYSGGHIDFPSLTNIDGTSIWANGVTFGANHDLLGYESLCSLSRS